VRRRAGLFAALLAGCAPSFEGEYDRCATVADCDEAQACVPYHDSAPMCRSRCRLDGDCRADSACGPDGLCRAECAAERPCVAPLICAIEPDHYTGVCVVPR